MFFNLYDCQDVFKFVCYLCVVFGKYLTFPLIWRTIDVKSGLKQGSFGIERKSYNVVAKGEFFFYEHIIIFLQCFHTFLLETCVSINQCINLFLTLSHKQHICSRRIWKDLVKYVETIWVILKICSNLQK